MFDPSDPNISKAIHTLRYTVSARARPIILWLGAGTSRWCGYPGWNELAHFFHSSFLRRATKYDKRLANSLLQGSDLPGFFQICKDADIGLYNSLLVESFRAPRPSPVFDRLIQLLSGVSPLFALTTNVDEALEKRLSCVTVQRSDLERVPDLVHAGTSFLGKLHGTISSIETTVFTREDYASLLDGKTVPKTIEHVLETACVIFLGYGLRDQYVLDQLSKARGARPLFGAGPHFAVWAKGSPNPPEGVQVLTYLDAPQMDHRGALQVLDMVSRFQTIVVSRQEPQGVPKPSERRLSAYFVAHFVPPGTWESSRQVIAVSPKKQIEVTIGTGFVNSEVPSGTATAMHDLIVGLICFDLVYLPFEDLPKVHDLLSSPWFWTLVNAGVIRFVYSARQPAVIFPDPSVVDGGDLGMIGLQGSDGQPMTIDYQIRRVLKSAPGKEAEAEVLFEKLKTFVVPISDQAISSLPELARGALLYPPVQEALGISEAFLPTKIPRWNVFPSIRLANLLLVGQVCHSLGIPATRIGFGGEMLVSTAFSVAAAQDWAEEVANYVLAARFDTDLGEIALRDENILIAILKFRDTPEGVSLRERIGDVLAVNEGSEFVASVNAGLKRNVPAKLLEQARNKLSGLLMPQNPSSSLTGAVWNNVQNADSSLHLWRSRSLGILMEYCAKNGIGLYDYCPCRSGERLRFCCLGRLQA